MYKPRRCLSVPFRWVCRKSRVAAEKRSISQPQGKLACAVFVLNVPLWCLRDPPTLPPRPFRIRLVHKGLTVFLVKGKKRNTTSEMSPHTHFHMAICIDLVKKFNGTEHSFAEWHFTWKPSSKNFRMNPFTLLNYQINIFPEKDFSCGAPMWYFCPSAYELLVETWLWTQSR